MNNNYEINNNDYKNLVKDLKSIGVSQVNTIYSAISFFALENDYLEFTGKFKYESYQDFRDDLDSRTFCWHLHGHSTKEKYSISEIMMDIACRVDFCLDDKYNLSEKKYRRWIEISLNVNEESPNLSIELSTPNLIIYDIKGLSFNNLNKKWGDKNAIL